MKGGSWAAGEIGSDESDGGIGSGVGVSLFCSGMFMSILLFHVFQDYNMLRSECLNIQRVIINKNILFVNFAAFQICCRIPSHMERRNIRKR